MAGDRRAGYAPNVRCERVTRVGARVKDSTRSALAGMAGWLIVGIPVLLVILLAGWVTYLKVGSVAGGVLFAVALAVWLLLLVRRYRRA